VRRKVAKQQAVTLLDMPLAKGRVAKSALVFHDGLAVLRLKNLEQPISWKLHLARDPRTPAADLAKSFSAFGSRHVHAFKDVPAEFSPPMADLAAGPSPAIDGVTEFGLQTEDDHEYFMSKFGDLVGIVRITRKAGGWSANLSKTLVPRVLTDEAVKKGLMPPPGHSGLPKSLEAVVPAEYRYWQASGEQAIAMRDALVESGFFSEDTIKAVDGELRKVEVRYYLYETQGDVGKSIKRLPTLADRVAKVVPEALMGQGFAPMAEDDWLEALDKNDAPGNLAILSPPDRTTNPREMARAAATLKGDFLLEHEDTKQARAAFSRVGQLFKLAGEPTRIFCASFPPVGAAWLGKAADGAVKKVVDFQGIKVSIDRPMGFVQTGKDAEGNEWSRTYHNDYGFLPRTNGGDGGSLDVFMGPSEKSDRVFWVEQRKADGTFDEFKIFLGFDAPGEVLDVFKAHIPVRFFGGLSEMTVAQMKALLNLDFGEVQKAVRAAVVKIAGVSYEQLRSAINAALTEAFPPEGDNACSPCGYYCEDIFDDKAIFYKEGKTYAIGYTYQNGAVTLSGEPVPVVRDWKPASELGGASPLAMAAPKKKPVACADKAVFDELEKRSVKLARATVQKDQRYVLGIVLEPDIVDAQNDTYSAEEIRGAFEKFAEQYRNVGLMHKQVINDRVAIVENYIAPADFQMGDTTIKKGTWLMGVRVNDPDLWSACKDGSITGFSIGGSAIRKPVSQGV
jgi:hypothetical protein